MRYATIAGLLTARSKAAMPAESGKVTTHVSAIHPNILHFTLSGPKADQLTNITAPTWQCVVETGILRTVASTTDIAEASSIQNPLKKLMLESPNPIVLITL